MPVVVAGAAIASLAYGVYSGERAQAQQRQARYRQREAQQQATQNALADMRRTDEANAQANRRQPDPQALLAGEADSTKPGATVSLSEERRRDLANMRVRLGKPSILGG